MVERPPYILQGGCMIVNTYAKQYPIRTPLSPQPYSCCDMEVLVLSEQGCNFHLQGGFYSGRPSRVTPECPELPEET
jgi:hypothetical protein